ncbi:MAG: amidohydrolase, partial [Candidatus Pacebacteria bacterium]|nr:amidohydrolase [Candidatus Paceibacterota bacterium]
MFQKALYNKIIALVLFGIILFGISYYKYYILDKNYNADILIQNAIILTLNDNSEIIHNGWIAIRGEEIIGIGEKEHDYKSKKIINAKGKIVMPGLVNTHTHVAMAPFRGIDDKSKFTEWLANINKFEEIITEEDVYWSSLFGEIEMIQSGTTTFNDMYFFEESVAKSVKKIGMRAVIDVPFYFENGEVKIEKDFLSKYGSTSTISFSIAPNPLVNFSEERLEEVKRIADKNDLIVHIHIAEDRKERDVFIDKYNKTPIEMLSISGILDNKIIFAHAVNFTEDEINYLSEYKDVGISFNSKSNYKLLGYTAPVKTMLENGLIIGIGTDSVGSSNSLDMFDQMNFIAFTSSECQNEKGYCKNESGLSPEKIVKMATIDGAKSLGLENEIGSIEEGKKADIILIDSGKIGLIPSYDIYSTLVYNTDGTDVTDSIINGKIVMADRTIVNIDENNIISKVNKIFEKIKNN